MLHNIFGIVPSLPTTFTQDLEIDYNSLVRVVNYAIGANVHGLVVMELQGEHFALTDEERKKVVETVLQVAKGRIPVIVGVSAASQEQSFIFARHAEKNGAAALLSTPPFFRAQSPQRIEKYFGLLNGITSLPIIVQSSPEGMGTAITVQQQLDLISRYSNIRYLINECVANQLVITEILERAKASEIDNLIGVGSGTGASMMLHDYYRGARLFMPSVELSEWFVELWDALEAGDQRLAMERYLTIAPVIMFGANYKRSFTKEMLKSRGIIDHAAVREASKPVLDDIQMKELIYWKDFLQSNLHS